MARDERVGEFLNRPLNGEWPYVWLDATYLKVRQGGRIVSIAAIIAVAVTVDGRREIIGLGTGPSEAETFWTAARRSGCDGRDNRDESDAPGADRGEGVARTKVCPGGALRRPSG